MCVCFTVLLSHTAGACAMAAVEKNLHFHLAIWAIWPLLAVLLAAQIQTAAADVLICKTVPKGAKVTEDPVTVWGQETM